MSIKQLVIRAALLFVLTASAFGQNENNTNDARVRSLVEKAREAAEREAHKRGYRIDAGQNYISIDVPSPISELELGHWAQILNLSDAQAQQLLKLYQGYLSDDWKFRERKIQPLWDQSAALAGSALHGRSVAAAQEFADLMSERSTAINELALREDQIISDLSRYLTEASTTTNLASSIFASSL